MSVYKNLYISSLQFLYYFWKSKYKIVQNNYNYNYSFKMKNKINVINKTNQN